MASKVISQTDYRYGLGDKYGRRKCDNCHKLRRINAHWQKTNKVLCKECSTTGHTAFNFSIRRATPNITPKETE